MLKSIRLWYNRTDNVLRQNRGENQRNNMSSRQTLLHSPSKIGRWSRRSSLLMASFVVMAVGTLGYMVWQKFSQPAQAMPPAKIVQVVGGDSHSLALASDGTVYAWGYNGSGQLGNNSTTNSSVPVAVTTTGTPMSGKTITAIAAGSDHSLALASDGTVYAWGYNRYGRLGNNSTTDSSVPVQTQLTLYGTPSVPNNLTTTPGNSSVALTWQPPITTYDQTITGYSLQYRPVGSTTWITTSITGNITSYTLNSLTNNTKYQLRLAAVTAGGVGDYSNIILATPTNPTIASITPNSGTPSGGTSTTITGTNFALKEKDIVQVAAGYYHTLALDVDGIVYSWGNNNYGQLGDGTLVNRRIPVAVNASGSLAGKRFVKIAAGYDTSFAIDSDGVLYSWGDNNHGQLGRGSMDQRYNSVPVAVTTASTPMSGKIMVDVVSGQATTLALDSNGVIYSWGYNDHGEVGNGTSGTDTISPALVKTTGTSISGKKIISIAEGEYYFLVVDEGGAVHSWGWNQNGELGNNTLNTSSNEPSAVYVNGTPMDGKVIVDIACGIWHSLAVDSDGVVYSWGDAEYGQLGDGQSGVGALSTVPVAVATTGTPMAGKKITSVSAGGNDWYQTSIPTSHSVAMADDGSVYAWGRNYAGGAATGGNENAVYSKPVSITTTGTPMAGKEAVQISTGLFNTFVLSTEGKVYSAGRNNYGQLGNNTTTNASVPVAVTTTGTSALAPSVPTATFGGTSATNVTLVNSTTITATTPAHTAGTVDVGIALGGTDSAYSATLTNGYTYATIPGAPTSLTATPAEGGVILGWTAPASNGGSVITDYIIQYSADGGTAWSTYADGTSTSTTVTVPTPTLNSTTTYTFRVAAVNAIGQSDWSSTASARVLYITLTAPSSVSINVTATGGTRMSSASQNAIVSTNSVAGYQLTLGSASTDRNLVNGSYSISPSTGTQTAPVVLANSSWGYRVPGIGGFGSGSGIESNTTTSSYTWSGIPTTSSPNIIRTQTTATTDQSTTVWYGVSITTSQPSGTYTGTVTYTAVTRD